MEKKTLDQRIKEDLQNLLTKHQIDAAVELSKELFGEAAMDEFAISTKGLPGYYTGDREAKTVMVMLNPGVSAKENDDEGTYEAEIRKYGLDRSSLETFTISYHSRCHTGVEKDIDKEGKIRKDNFDVKQAAFLKDWTDCGVDISADFPAKAKEDDDILRDVRVKVLEQKLQLELVPYASQKFRSLGTKKLCHLFPYLEIALDEIFRVNDRKYIIFCAGFFEKLFKAYSKDKDRNFQIKLLEKQPCPNIINGANAYCTPVRIEHNGKVMIAVIAHTFPNYALPNAYEKMQQYGKFCFDCWQKIEK